MKLFNVFDIKNRRLRRVVMVAVFVPVVIEAVYNSLRQFWSESKFCWNYEYGPLPPIDQTQSGGLE